MDIDLFIGVKFRFRINGRWNNFENIKFYVGEVLERSWVVLWNWLKSILNNSPLKSIVRIYIGGQSTTTTTIRRQYPSDNHCLHSQQPHRVPTNPTIFPASILPFFAGKMILLLQDLPPFHFSLHYENKLSKIEGKWFSVFLRNFIK